MSVGAHAGTTSYPGGQPGKKCATDDTNTVVALSSVSSSTASRITVGATDLCALACAASAGVHGALVAPHASEAAPMAVAFVLVTTGLAIAALGLALQPSPNTSTASAALLVAVATAYLLSRTTGIPRLTDHPEPFDALGVAVSTLEVAAAVVAVVAVRQLNPRRH